MDMIFNIANYLHMLAAMVLLLKVWATQSCAGISGKTQFLIALIYITRYMDLYYVEISKENTFCKISYLSLGFTTVLSIYAFFKKSYERKYDTFRIEILIIPCMVIALLVNYEFTALEVFWAFSIYLEAVVMLPQFHFIAQAKYIHKHVLYYILALSIYKCLYIGHWIYRYNQTGHYDKFSVASGIVQFILYCDFFARVLPHLGPKPSDDAIIVNTILTPSDLETGALPGSGNFRDNISTIVLTPASLVTTTNDKVNLLKAEEAAATN